MALLFFWAIYVNFTASKYWEHLSQMIALELATLLSLLFYWSMWTERINLPSSSWIEMAGAVVLVPLMTFFGFWFSLEVGGGDLANRVFGRIESIEMRFESKSYDAEEQCLKATGVAKGKNVAEDFCLTAASYSSYSGGTLPQNFRATLVVKHSVFGHHPYKLESVSVLPAAGDRSSTPRGG